MTFAPGKVILTGEHAVVYGYPAIAVPVSLGVTVDITPRKGVSYCSQADLDQRLWTAIREVVPEYGYNVTIHSSLPLGRGMGSSAALSVALIREMARINNRSMSLEEECDVAMRMEKVFHGTPSGLDHTVSAIGQAIYFHKNEQQLEWVPISLPKIKFLVIDSGSAGSTSEMVAEVAKTIHLEQTQMLLKQIGDTTIAIQNSIEQNDIKNMARLCLDNHILLQKLGVSTPTIDLIVQESLNMGAWGAKLSGSGGGGIVLIFGPELEKYQDHFTRLGYDGFILSPANPIDSSHSHV